MSSRPRKRNVGCLSRTCGWLLARAYSSASEISATISGYLGSPNDEFDAAMGDFALAHANQTERDHAVLKAAVRKGRITVWQESTPSRPYAYGLRIFCQKGKLPIRLEPLQQPRQMLSTLSSR